MSTTLNTAAYTTVWDDNFAASPTINSSLFPRMWGDSSEFSASNGGLTLTDDGNAAGFMRADGSAGDADGYGLYSVTMKANALTTGAYVALWPATNVWPGPEVDFYETINNQPYLTVHWAGSNGSNQYHSYFMPSSFNAYNANTIALDWESGSLTFYVNGQKLVGYTAGGSVPIPTDYAHGGQNESFGVGLGGGSKGASITLYDMRYAKPSGTPVASGATGGTSTSGASSTTPISISAPGTVTGTTPYSESITFSDPGLANRTIYAVTMNAQNQFEENWIPITLNSSGIASHAMTFQHSGDYMIAVGNTSTEANKGFSSRITVNAPSATTTTTTTAPSSWITISNPGTVTASSGIATETIHFSDPGLSGVAALVMNNANVAEENWSWVPFNSSGQGSMSMTFQHTGDYVLAVANSSTQTDKSWSSRITING